ncbi:MAG: Ig-like domain-containing protein [Campylobacterota bacterium]|nr:Ig-like domain-containing protein [Campylobacterota bacterium]
MKFLLHHLLLFVGISLMLMSCAGYSEPETPEYIEILPKDKTVPVDAKVQFFAMGYYADGSVEDITDKVFWSSKTPQVASCSEGGSVRGVESGKAEIVASFNNKVFAHHKVDTKKLNRLVLSHSDIIIAKDFEKTVTLKGVFEDNSTESLDEDIEYSSDNSGVVSVDGLGLVSAHSAGRTVVRAKIAGLSTHLDASVNNATLLKTEIVSYDFHLDKNVSKQLEAKAYFSDRRVEDITYQGLWKSRNNDIAQVFAGGVLHTVDKGKTEVTLEYHDVSSTQNIEVVNKEIKDLVIHLENRVLSKGFSDTLAIYALFNDNTFLTPASGYLLKSSDPSIVSVSELGVISALKEGSVDISVVYHDVQASIKVTVNDSVLEKIVIDPRYESMPKRISFQNEARAYFSDGRVQDITYDGVWESSNEDNVSIISSGLVEAFEAGDYNLSFLYQKKTLRVPLHVEDNSLNRILLKPTQSTLSKAYEMASRVTAVFEDNTTHNIVYDLYYESNDTSIATVDSNGIIYGKSKGSAKITAYLNDKRSESVVHVNESSLERVEITPVSLVLNPNMRHRYGVRAYFSDNRAMNIPINYLYVSRDSNVATLNNQGLVSAFDLGSSVMDFYYHNTVTSGMIHVDQNLLKALLLAKKSTTLSVGFSERIDLSAQFSDNRIQTLNSGINFTSSDTSIASVDTDGLVLAKKIGTCKITVELNGVYAYFDLVVNDSYLESVTMVPSALSIPANYTYQYQAVAKFSDDRSVSITFDALFESQDKNIATIEDGGVLRSHHIGVTDIYALYHQMQTQARLHVNDIKLDRLYLMPQNTTLSIGYTQQITVHALFEDNSTIASPNDLEYFSADESVVSVNSLGEILAHGVGHTYIDVSLHGVHSRVLVTVNDSILSKIEISPQYLNLPINAKYQYQSLAYFSDGRIKDLTFDGHWLTQNFSVASIDNAAMLSAISEGYSEIVFIYNKLETHASVNVQDAEVEKLLVSPQVLYLAKGFNKLLTLQALYSDATTHDVIRDVIYSSEDATIASVDNNGLVQANKVGDTMITIYYADQSTELIVHVSDATLEKIELKPIYKVLPASINVSLQTMALFSDGSKQDVSFEAIYESSNPDVASIISTATLQTHKEGVSDVNVVYHKMSDQTHVEVADKELDVLVVSPANTTLSVGFATQVNTQAIYNDNTSFDVTTASQYASSNTDIARVDSNGKITAIGVGSCTVEVKYASVTQSIIINVSRATLLRVELLALNPYLSNGLDKQLQAKATFSDGRVEDITYLASYESSSPDVASVSSGLVHGNSVGMSTITLYYQGVSNTFNIYVNSSVLRSLTITSQSYTLSQGFDATAKLSGTFSDGRVEILNNDVIWESLNESIVSIDQNAKITAHNSGTTQICATYSTMRSCTTMTVNTSSLRYVEIRPSYQTLSLGSKAMYEAKAYFSDGRIQDVTFNSLWQSSDNTIASFADELGVMMARSHARGSVDVIVLYHQNRYKTRLTITF